MALTETRPETEVGQSAEETTTTTTTLDGLIGSADHKTIGRMWIALGLLVLLIAAGVTAVAGFEATDLSGFTLLQDGEEFTQVWSLGRELLVFGAIVPILIGLGTYLVPLQVGAPAIAFPRGAAAALWTWMLGVDLLVLAYLFNGGPGGGQTDFVVLWAVALGMMIVGLCLAMVTIATTVLGARTTGMSLERAPQTTWAFFVFSLIGLLSLPIILAELVLVYVQVRHGFLPLGARDGLTGVLNMVSFSPGLYWLAVPVLGMAVDMIGVHTSNPVRAHRPVLGAVGALGLLSYGANYYAMGSVRTIDFNHELLAVAIAVSILPILGVLALSGPSLRAGRPKVTPSLIGSLLAGLLLLLAAVVSLLGLAEPLALFLADDVGANIDLDRVLVLNGTTFHDGVRGLVVGAVLVGAIAALHHWSTKIWGRRASQPFGFLAVLATAGGAFLWGLGAVLAGVDDQAAYPVSTLTGGGNVEIFNTIAWIGMLLVFAGMVIAVFSLLGAIFGSGRADDPWTGTSLEWLADSPPSHGNFAAAPVVRSPFPLEDMAADAEAEAESNADAEED
ncbi:MAG: cbb3-type cytochrome c oxidase subunit I [Actinomycetota bacterium]